MNDAEPTREKEIGTATEPADDGLTVTDGGTKTQQSADAFEPVQVFPDDGPMDLREGADHCYKCTTCDTTCPVAAVDDEFPGPKFQGPEQWRLKRKEDTDIDASVMSCSNCMRCDDACPAGVPLSQMHNVARAEYVDEGMSKLSREYVRNRILSNYGTLARIGSTVPRLTNFVMGLGVTQWVNERVLGVTSEREFPTFAEETFRTWFAKRGGSRVQHEEKRVAYFHGDYANYNTPEVAKALVRTFEAFGYEVAVPPQRCSGTPMFANGMLDDARRAARFNVETFAELVADGYDVVCSCTSCSMALRQEYPELFDFPDTETVASNTYEAIEYLRIHEDLSAAIAEADGDAVEGAGDNTGDGAGDDAGDGDGDGASDDSDARSEPPAFAYHAPCHARNQGLAGQAVELFGDVDGVEIEDVGPSCSGISGTYGWKAEKYETSMQIGEAMFEHMEAARGTTGMTECPTCAMQMKHGTGYDIQHPLQLLEALVVE